MARRPRRPVTGGEQWQWRAGGPVPQVEASVFAGELERLAGDDPVELVQPQAIVEAARSRRSPIHELFNWNLAEAAEAHWLDHARALVGRLQLVRVVVENGPTTSSRGWWSVTVADRRGYVPQQRILSDRDLTLQTIARVKRELEVCLAKYLTVLQFGTVIPQLREVIDDIEEEIDRLEAEATRPVRRRFGPGTQPSAQPSAE